ncbi:retrovirus-related pol polyprotein from transposon TNT 1-94 [Tanacetum coccineum]
MMLLARAITQKFSTPTNNRYSGNGNKNARRQSMNQAFNAENGNDDSNQIIQRVPRNESTPGKANVQCYNCNEKGHYARDCQKPRVCDAKNDFMLDTSNGEETMEELTTTVMLMARVQPADGNVETMPSYDAKAVSEVNASSKGHEQMHHEKRKIIFQTSDDDQIDSNFIFNDLLKKTPNKVYDPFLKAGLGYKNLERLKKAIAAQPKMYDGEKLHSVNLKIHSPDSEETLEDA